MDIKYICPSCRSRFESLGTGKCVWCDSSDLIHIANCEILHEGGVFYLFSYISLLDKDAILEAPDS